MNLFLLLYFQSTIQVIGYVTSCDDKHHVHSQRVNILACGNPGIWVKSVVLIYNQEITGSVCPSVCDTKEEDQE